MTQYHELRLLVRGRALKVCVRDRKRKNARTMPGDAKEYILFWEINLGHIKPVTVVS